LKYDFDQLCDRDKTDCLKWDMMESIFGSGDLLPLWVADMDLPVAKPIIDALKKRVEHPFYGYTKPGSSVINSVVERMKRKFNWDISPEWIVFTPGVVPALHVAVRSLTHPGDEVILQEPTYHPFFPVVINSGCKIINNGLKLVNGRYVMDYDGLEEKFHPKTRPLNGPGRIKTIIFCNPHNPVGRLWKRDEIIRMGEIIIDNGAVVISDEIHCEILFKGNKHTPFASISKKFEQNCIVCMSPSKTFNLAGLEVSSIIIPNKKILGEILTNSYSNKVWEGVIGISYGSSPEKSIELIRKVLANDPDVVKSTEPQVGIQGFGDSAIQIGLRYWLPTRHYYTSAYRVNLAIWKSFSENGVELPFPQQEVRILK